MKKLSRIILIMVSALFVLTACGDDSGDLETLKIGASPDPHAKILEFIEDDLKEEGIQLEIQEFTDYFVPNMALAEGKIDANFFQHEPYLVDFIEEEDLDLISLGQTHVEPMALYSESIDDLASLKDGSEIAIPNDTVNGARALILLEENGLIKVDRDKGLNATEKDIIENPKDLQFNPLEAALMPKSLDDVDGAVINGNYALEAGLNPVHDGIIVEGEESPYANVIAVRTEDKSESKFVTLLRVLQSEKVSEFIEDEYNGAIVPAF